MLMNNMLVILFISLPFMVFLGLKYLTYKRYKKMEKADEINSILIKHSKSHVFENKPKVEDDKKKAA